MLTILSFIFVFGIVAITHELAHMIWARRAGMRVYEFGLGLGPKIFGIIKGKTEYTLRLFPLGGFVRIAGIEGNTEEEKNCPEEEKYTSKTWGQKFKSILAGPLSNIVLASVIFCVIFSLVGSPAGVTNEIDTIVPGSPAEKVGLQRNDKIIELDGKPILEMSETIETIHQSVGKLLTLKILRNNNEKTIKVAPQYDPKRKIALIGFSPKLKYEKFGPLKSIRLGLQQTLSIILLSLQMIGMLITGKAGFGDVMGPVGIAQFSGQVARQGIVALIQFIGFLSVLIGVMNLLPLPALDGGRLLFLIIEKIRGKALDVKKENLIHLIGLITLLILFALVTINDVRRILGN
jgi:regulator of sigma E protease